MSFRRFTIAFIAVSAMLAGILVQSAAAKKFECNGTFSNRTFHGGVVVRAGDDCTLNNSVVTGGMRVTGGTFNLQNVNISGGLRITGGTQPSNVESCGVNINGGLRITGTSNPGSWVFGEFDNGCAGGTINGGVRADNNTGGGFFELDGNVVHGRVIDSNNTTSSTLLPSNELEGNTVHGSARCVNNNEGPINDEGGPNSYTGHNNGCPTS